MLERNFTLSEEVISQYQSIVDSYLYLGGPDAIGEIEGISIVRHTNTLPPETDCCSYLFGTKDLGTVWNYITYNKNPIERQPGATAFYFNKRKELTHVGLVTEDGMIISKWNEYGHVYKHPPLLVLSDYGTTIQYYPTPENMLVDRETR